MALSDLDVDLLDSSTWFAGDQQAAGTSAAGSGATPRPESSAGPAAPAAVVRPASNSAALPRAAYQALPPRPVASLPAASPEVPPRAQPRQLTTSRSPATPRTIDAVLMSSLFATGRPTERERPVFTLGADKDSDTSDTDSDSDADTSLEVTPKLSSAPFACNIPWREQVTSFVESLENGHWPVSFAAVKEPLNSATFADIGTLVWFGAMLKRADERMTERLNEHAIEGRPAGRQRLAFLRPSPTIWDQLRANRYRPLTQTHAGAPVSLVSLANIARRAGAYALSCTTAESARPPRGGLVTSAPGGAHKAGLASDAPPLLSTPPPAGSFVLATRARQPKANANLSLYLWRKASKCLFEAAVVQKQWGVAHDALPATVAALSHRVDAGEEEWDGFLHACVSEWARGPGPHPYVSLFTPPPAHLRALQASVRPKASAALGQGSQREQIACDAWASLLLGPHCPKLTVRVARSYLQDMALTGRIVAPQHLDHLSALLGGTDKTGGQCLIDAALTALRVAGEAGAVPDNPFITASQAEPSSAPLSRMLRLEDALLAALAAPGRPPANRAQPGPLGASGEAHLAIAEGDEDTERARLIYEVTSLMYRSGDVDAVFHFADMHLRDIHEDADLESAVLRAACLLAPKKGVGHRLYDLAVSLDRCLQPGPLLGVMRSVFGRYHAAQGASHKDVSKVAAEAFALLDIVDTRDVACKDTVVEAGLSNGLYDAWRASLPPNHLSGVEGQ